MLIYTPKLSSRIKYIFDFIFKEILKTTLEYTTDLTTFSTFEGAKINYSTAQQPNSLFFKQTNFLLETRITPVKPETIYFGTGKVPFPVDESSLPFDVFSAGFYLLSRYEEYVFNSKNGPFKASDSIQHRNGTLEQPVIDEWALLIKNLILKKFPGTNFGSRRFRHLPTIRTHLPPLKPTGLINKGTSLLNSLRSSAGRGQLFDRLTGLAIDTDKNINFLNTLFRTHSLNPFYFIYLPQQPSDLECFDVMARKITVPANFGIQWPCKVDTHKTSVTRLEELFSDMKIPNEPATFQTDSLIIPECYLPLLKSKINTDFSMGYLDRIGFRAGTCTPFHWYDLQVEKQTSLIIYPYCLTDISTKQLSLQVAKTTLSQLIERIKMVDGLLCSSWNLESMSENTKFRPWRTLYESHIAEAGK